MSVVAIKIMGGLASQMHKYAIGRSLADVHNCELQLDLSWFAKPGVNDTKREFLLDKFNTRFAILGAHTRNALKSSLIQRKLTALSARLGLKSNFLRASHYVRGQSPLGVLSAVPPIYIEGEWFGGELLQMNRAALLNDFTLREPLSGAPAEVLDIIQARECVAIHVRRGDFVHNIAAANFHYVTALGYYEKAIEQCASSVTSPLFLVFSDDVMWAKENFSKIPGSFFFVEGNSPYIDLYLIKSCRHQIISNSGFGWFGAWLNTVEQKTLIAPKLWVKDEVTNANILRDLLGSGFRIIG